tara:strand:- start:119 stop:757 length:639 start_codon:yes stop_codon:yes gene_type:complete
MKRFLLPLLSVLALPLAFDVNPFVGDVIDKNAFGEKTTVKKKTIDSSEVFRVKDLNTYPTSIDSSVKLVQGYVKKWEEKFANCLESSKWGPSFCYEVQEYPSTISYYQGLLSEYKKDKADREELVKYLKRRLPAEYKRFNPNRIIYIKVTYTPIFENINRTKSVQNEAEVKCWNKSINYSFRSKTLSSLERKICNKYAKFSITRLLFSPRFY